MEEKQIKKYEELFEKFKKASMICYGSPDQFQYRQNELLHALAEFILMPFWQWQHENATKNKSGDEKSIH